ncbi:LPXTG-motif cell wall anchor domain-containing protein [Halosimplex carlsbadense 2-9-1]|uniref:LPXTG-motif cell wall anchor domain-containing protein n=1 Tax=Halosimplex carlsbadense 2-9-1 TaxID=797114 RepID=M0CXW6_9EURY|nr:glycoside hydrolase family 9 protein [Halosimplex carlsbadense]ELZ27473.1 LPXTG-motif cell wall anchor domain-containing protein [Halosimplex carlsbadense 2-9-1]
MADDGERWASRRALLAAGVSGAAALAGCPGESGSTATPSGADSGAEGADASTGSGRGDRGGTGATTDAAETDASGTDTDPTEPGEAVLVDQVGYRPDDPKTAVVRADASTFAVTDAESGETVASGDLAGPTDDDASGDTVRHAAFDDVRDPGTYRVTAGDGAAASHEFDIGEGVYGRTLAEICRRYTLRRANTRIDDPVTDLAYEPGHPQDREARMYFGDSFHDEGERIDARGGWYDAGDYGKYVTPGAVTVAQLLLAYERNPDSFDSGQLALPDGVSTAEREAGLPDLLAEAKFELEWLERMQRPDGAAYHKVAGGSWPSMDTRPSEDTQPRYVFGLSTYGTGMVAAVSAMAARVYREFDADFADRMLANARDAFSYLESNPDPVFRRDDGQNDGSGGYAKETDRTERFWAAAELLKTTGESRFADYLEDELAAQFEATPPAVSWANTLLLGHWAYYTADAADPERRSAVGDRLVADADRLVERVRSEGYRVALSTDQYYWASAKLAVAQGVKLLLADEVEAREAYVDAALDQVHYVLGRTPTARSYVTGSGERAPQNPHSRTVESTGVNVPGNLVGGPNADGGDPALDELIATEDPPPAKCYLDETASYASNEPAIDYAAPLVVALAQFTPASAVGVQ